MTATFKFNLKLSERELEVEVELEVLLIGSMSPWVLPERTLGTVRQYPVHVYFKYCNISSGRNRDSQGTVEVNKVRSGILDSTRVRFGIPDRTQGTFRQYPGRHRPYQVIS